MQPSTEQTVFLVLHYTQTRNATELQNATVALRARLYFDNCAARLRLQTSKSRDIVDIDDTPSILSNKVYKTTLVFLQRIFFAQGDICKSLRVLGCNHGKPIVKNKRVNLLPQKNSLTEIKPVLVRNVLRDFEKISCQKFMM